MTAPRSHSRAPRRRQRGIATVEYVIGAVFLCLVLFTGSPSLAEQLLTAIRDNHSARAYAIGAPLVGTGVRP